MFRKPYFLAKMKGLFQKNAIFANSKDTYQTIIAYYKMEFKVLNQKIAIPTANGVLFSHFGRAPEITIFTVVAGMVAATEVLKAPEHEHGVLPRFLAGLNCTDVICGGIGAGAVELLNQLGIKIHGGAPELPVAQIMEQYLNGTIVFGDSTCSHDGCHHEH